MFTKLSVLIAAYNEERTLAACVTAVMKAGLPEGLSREVIVVDDGSVDGTRRVMEELRLEYPDAMNGTQARELPCGERSMS